MVPRMNNIKIIDFQSDQLRLAHPEIDTPFSSL